MARPHRQRVRLKLWALMMTSFVIVAAVATMFVGNASVARFKSDARADLKTLVNVVATGIDPVAHEKLVDPEQMESELYRQQIAPLAAALKAAPDIRFVYTMRKTPKGVVFVLDPTPPGDADKDGVDDKSYLMDAYPEISYTALQAFVSGGTMVEDEPVSDRWGTFLSAYAPIKNDRGQTVAVLGIDREASNLEMHAQKIYGLAWWCFLSACLLGLILSFVIMNPLETVRLSWLESKDGKEGKHATRMMILQFVLAAAVMGALGAGVLSFARSAEDELKIVAETNRSDAISKFRIRVADLAISRNSATEFLSTVQQAAQESGQSDIQRIVADSRLGENPSDAAVKQYLLNLSGQLETLGEQTRKRRAQIFEAALDRNQFFQIGFGLAVLLSLGALLLIRAALAQQNRLVQAIQKVNQHEQAFQNVVESVPVGIFKLHKGSFIYSNWNWDAQVMRSPGESHHAALLRSLHPEDRDNILERLSEFEDREETFTLNYRLVDDEGQMRYYEARGVPVYDDDGQLEHMLGFTIDVTESSLAHVALQDSFNKMEEVNERLEFAIQDLEDNFEAMVHSWVKAVEAKDPYTAGHSERVMSYSVRIGQELGLDAPTLRILEMGTLVHDLGKIGIPDDILLKPSRLTDDEFEVIKAHPVIGHRMIAGIPCFKDCVPIVRWHHERLDGGGYPDGIQGDEIPLLVRIASVADAFDAMTSNRAYRGSRSADEAIGELRKDVENGRIDGKIVEVLADIVQREGVLWQLPFDDDLSKAA